MTRRVYLVLVDGSRAKLVLGQPHGRAVRPVPAHVKTGRQTVEFAIVGADDDVVRLGAERRMTAKLVAVEPGLRLSPGDALAEPAAVCLDGAIAVVILAAAANHRVLTIEDDNRGRGQRALVLVPPVPDYAAGLTDDEFN